jgi:hypothetical protein
LKVCKGHFKFIPQKVELSEKPFEKQPATVTTQAELAARFNRQKRGGRPWLLTDVPGPEEL